MLVIACAMPLLVLAACQPQAADSTNEVPPVERPDSTSAVPSAEQPDTEPRVGDAAAVLTAHGWGALRIGMTRAEVVAAAGEDANPDAVGGADPEQCDQFRPRRAPKGLLVMMEQGRLTRISLSAPATVKTDRGFQVGDSAAAIKTAYGAAAQAGLHKYQDPPAEYITVWTTRPPAPAARGIVYEIGGNARVMHIHAGGPSIQYVEGCL
jgi:hypothetical protein